MNSKVCKNCGEDITLLYGVKTYCSKFCCHRWNYEKRKVEKRIGEINRCAYCEKEFKFGDKNSSLLFCSFSCRVSFYNERLSYMKNSYKIRIANSQKIKTACKNCKKIFMRPINFKNQIFCCKECGREWHKNDNIKNREITHFDIFKYDNFTCQYCGKTPTDGAKLVVDHIFPIHKGGNGKRFNLTTACRDCNQVKAATPLSKEETIRRWTANQHDFDDYGLKKYWNKITSIRKDRFSNKSK